MKFLICLVLFVISRQAISLGREACSENCDYNITTGGQDPACDGIFFNCQDPSIPPILNECPSESPCFDVRRCECVTVEELTPCNSSCPLLIEGGTCPLYYFCDDQGNIISEYPQICPQGFCYVQDECSCFYQTPSTTTTSTTTLYPCDEQCLVVIFPDYVGPGCDAYAQCDSPINVITCPTGCFNATICGCSD